MYNHQCTVYFLAKEPRGTTYESLIRAGAVPGSTFGLVVRDGEVLLDRAESLLQALSPELIEEVLAKEWPGTRLLDDSVARVLTYRLSPQALRLLISAARGLYEWQHPELPEDLFIRGSNGRTWLTSVAHEGEAFLSIPSEEAARLQEVAPGLFLEKGEAACPENA